MSWRFKGVDHGDQLDRPEPFGIDVMNVDPGFFRAKLLVGGLSTIRSELKIGDYAERTEQTIAAWSSMNHQQGGDPAKLAAALVTLSDPADLPWRFIARADAMEAVEGKPRTLQAQVDAQHDLSASLSNGE